MYSTPKIFVIYLSSVSKVYDNLNSSSLTLLESNKNYFEYYILHCILFGVSGTKVYLRGIKSIALP